MRGYQTIGTHLLGVVGESSLQQRRGEDTERLLRCPLLGPLLILEREI